MTGPRRNVPPVLRASGAVVPVTAQPDAMAVVQRVQRLLDALDRRLAIVEASSPRSTIQ